MPADGDHPPTDPPRTLVAVEATPAALGPRLAEAWAGGPAVLPLDPRLPPRARGALVASLKPGATVKPGGLVGLPGATPVADDVVAVVATSGSSGAPKGVELTRSGLQASVEAGLARTGADPDVPWVACLPVSHVGGLLVLMRGLLTDTPVIDVEGFDAEAIAALAGPVHLAVVPTMLRRLLDVGGDPRRWPTVLVGGARVPEDLRAAVPQLTTTYGMTETTGGCVYDGVPLDDVVVAEADDGRLRIGGATLMRGYRSLDAPSPTPPPAVGLDADAMFTTADIGEVDADGVVTVLGRVDDVIVTGGEKVVATRVAARLEAHPAIAEAEVLGVPDEDWGQRAVAVVVPAEAGAVLSLALLRSFVADEMPRYAAPQDLVIVNTLPRLSSGKVDRMALRQAVLDR